jgi:hypothetical protein
VSSSSICGSLAPNLPNEPVWLEFDRLIVAETGEPAAG